MNRSILSALAITILLVAWMLSGATANIPESTEQKITNSEKPPMKVKIRLSKASTMTRRVTVKGQVEALRMVTIQSETQGQVREILVSKGDRITAGETVVRLAMNDRKARLAEARAVVSQHQHDVSAHRNLFEKKLKPLSLLKTAQANLAASKARLEQINWEIGRTVIKAPFAGIINKLPVELGTFIQVGDSIATIVDDSTLLLTAQAPQLAALELTLGQQVTATLINGTILVGQISFISTTAESGTRSYRIEARVDNPRQRPLTGLSATLTLPVGDSQAHKIAPSVLGLGSDGRLTVKTVDEDDNVEIHPVKLLKRDQDGMWVSGLPETARLIVLGQEYLTAGERVIATSSTKNKP
jgi:membrane fusion protein, multidrug efflux system